MNHERIIELEARVLELQQENESLKRAIEVLKSVPPDQDPRYEAQYASDLSFGFFLMPRNKVAEIKSVGKQSVAMNSNLATAKAQPSEALKRHLVLSETRFKVFSQAQ